MNEKRECPYCNKHIGIGLFKIDNEAQTESTKSHLENNTAAQIKTEDLNIYNIQSVIDNLQSIITKTEIKLKATRRTRETMLCEYLELNNAAKFTENDNSKTNQNSDDDPYGTPAFIRRRKD